MKYIISFISSTEKNLLQILSEKKCKLLGFQETISIVQLKNKYTLFI